MSVILAIESSCDDTSAAVIKDGQLLSNVISTQEVHKAYGGVVPELASRAHQQNIVPVITAALKQAKINKRDLNAVAYTKGPGLLGPLLVANSFAKGFALSNNIPLIGVNHMKAHILAHFIDEPKPNFPFLCLTVSGGHTQVVKVNTPLDMVILGETIDDAVGEAFDKSAKLMGFPYPGGPFIDKFAKEGDPSKFEFPIVSMQGYNFSFSGIKTAFLYFLQKETKKDPNFVENNKNDICASLQHALIETLLRKLRKAARTENIKDIAIAGGVSANSGLRTGLHEMGKKEDWNIFIPDFQYCTDNAGMIAMAAHFMYQEQKFEPLDATPDPRLKIV